MTRNHQMLAYHNDPQIKSDALAAIKAHREADNLTQGYGYWQDGKGCAIGCQIQSDNHMEYERKCLTNGDGASTANVGSASSEQARIAAVQRSTRHRATVSRLTQRRQTQQSNG